MSAPVAIPGSVILPVPNQTVAQRWVNTPLAHFDYTAGSTTSSFDAIGVKLEVMKPNTGWNHPTITAQDFIAPGKNFSLLLHATNAQDALSAASILARQKLGSIGADGMKADGFSNAVAVLDAHNGQYFSVNLGVLTGNRSTGMTIDLNTGHTINVTALNPDLVGVAGPHSQVLFDNRQASSAPVAAA